VGQAAGDQDADEPATQINESFVIHKLQGNSERQVPKLSFKTKKEAKAEVDKRMKARSEYDKERGIKFEYRKGNDGNLLKPARTSKAKKIGLKEGFRNSYSVGDRVMTPTGTGTIVWVSPKVNVDDMVRVKLDDPSQAGDDGKDKDTFRYTTSMLKFLKEAKNPAMARAKSVAKMAKNAPSFKKTMAKKTVKEGKSEDQLDDEFDREMRKLDKMLKNGEITHEEYKEEERALRRELNS
jgi:hypothetical protein